MANNSHYYVKAYKTYNSWNDFNLADDGLDSHGQGLIRHDAEKGAFYAPYHEAIRDGAITECSALAGRRVMTAQDRATGYGWFDLC